jgi:hypothetical protein
MVQQQQHQNFSALSSKRLDTSSPLSCPVEAGQARGSWG